MKTQTEIPLKNKIAKLINENKSDIISVISEIVHSSNFKFSKLINKYDNYTYLFLYDIEKAEKEKKKNSTKTEMKEIQLSPNIAENDLLTKAKKAKEFLEDQDKVKCVITLKGRQKAMPAAGELVMLKFAETLSEYGLPETLPKMEGNKWLMILKPKKK